MLEDIGFNILAGMHVRVEGGGITKDHEVLTLGAPLADSESNTVRGTATPNVWVTVHIFGRGVSRHVQADEHGNWLADFSEPEGDEPWEDFWDIVDGTEGEARVIDEDGNATTVEWRHTESPIQIHIVWLEVDFGPDDNLCIFECWIEGPGIMGARVKAPEKDWDDLITEDWFAQDWEYVAEESSYEDLATEFPAGEYLVEITTIDGTTITTVAVSPVFERPNSLPVIVSPASDAEDVLWPEAMLVWEQPADPNFNLILVEVEGDDYDSWQEDRFEDITTSEYLMRELEPLNYYFGFVGFANLDLDETEHGAMLTLARARFKAFEFSTGAEPQPEMAERMEWYDENEFELLPDETWSMVENRDRYDKGMTLREEFIALTDPTNPQSVFQIKKLSGGSDNQLISISFEPTSDQRLYTLQYRESLTEGEWKDVDGKTQVEGGGQFEGVNLDDSLYYRVIVELPVVQ